ncbi:Glycosyltransferase involved in cell wall bisynthesis [Roseivivax marinus]|uniref:GT4 family glycosyltransferase PelF n=1 Tax=Roseivivax marinus TaxID=1379903 RepID=UPI0008D16798|nr:GT4 family glycosyltransferase PelF [Roseivivax marinus]SEL51979.1 Glycosyltransferase involved in cell wall bisynthesis [Roseivivax marinus]
MSSAIEAPQADVCIVVEGCYPFVAGGVSSWLDWLIRTQPETTFSVVALTADAQPRDLKYELPDNVVGLQTLPLSPPSRRPRPGRPEIDGDAYGEALTRLWSKGDPQAFDELADLARRPVRRRHFGLGTPARRPDHADLVSSGPAWTAIETCARALAPEAPLSDVFWAWRTLVGGLMSVLTAPVPKARVYHAISTGYAGLYAARAARETGGRAAITEHGIYTNERRIDLVMAGWLSDRVHKGFRLDDTRREVRDLWTHMFEGFARVAYARTDRITTLYGANQTFQRALGAEEDRLSVIPNGIALQKFEGLTPVTGKPRPVVGLIGRVVPIKDIEACIRAAAVVRDAVPDVEWLIIGPTEEDEDYFAACQRRVVELKLEDTVRFTGRMNIFDILPSLDVMLLTSISEAQPLVLLEAGAARIPCVATDVGSCREILEGPPGEDPPLGRGGFVAPPMDPDALGAAVLKLLEDPELRRSCGETLRARVEAGFTSEASAARYAALYRELAA